MLKEDIHNNYITSVSKFIFNRYITVKSQKNNVFDCPTIIYQLINKIGYTYGERLFSTKAIKWFYYICNRNIYKEYI